MLNEFFFYAFSKVSSWQSMSEFQVTTVATLDDIAQLIMNSTYQPNIRPLPRRNLEPRCRKCHVCPGTSSRISRPPLTSFVAVAPFFRSKDPRVASRTDKFFAKALDTFKLLMLTTRTSVRTCVASPRLGTGCFRPSIARIAWMTIRRSRITRDPRGRTQVIWKTWQHRAPCRQRTRMRRQRGLEMKPDLHSFPYHFHSMSYSKAYSLVAWHIAC